MRTVPANAMPVLVRTDYSDDAAWQDVRAALTELPSELRRGVELMKAMNAAAGVDVSGLNRPTEFMTIIDDRRWSDCTLEQVVALVAKDSKDACLFIVDQKTMSNPDHPVLVVDLSRHRRRTFRAIPSEVGGIAANLSIANMDWEDFANHLDRDNVFRGFSLPVP